MVNVAIEYCAPCRVGGKAVTIKRTLADRLRKYDEIEHLTVTPTPEELFRVNVDGESVWSVAADDRVDPMEAVAAVRSRLRS